MSEIEEKMSIAEVKKEVFNYIFEQLNELKENGLILPPNYNAVNALNMAWLEIEELKGKDKETLALASCTKKSINNALLDMLLNGLSTYKKQGYFIVMGNKLKFMRSYFGTITILRRNLPNIKNIASNIIYDKDLFEYEISVETGEVRLLKHQTALENIDLSHIKGAYTIINFNDGTPSHIEIMTYEQIMQAWKQGKAIEIKDSIHSKFTDEMAKKTVLNRAAKLYINTIDDNWEFEEFENVESTANKVLDVPDIINVINEPDALAVQEESLKNEVMEKNNIKVDIPF